jgi:UDP-N-acetylmuramoyl-tripeptide--D-alanyl-D-alanine ligase
MKAFDCNEIAGLLEAQWQPEAPTGTLPGLSTDTRTLAAGELFVALRGPNHDGHDWLAAARARGACAALVERWQPDPLPQLRVADTRRALGLLAAAWRTRFAGPVLAVTGSNGKTTVKEMLAAILRQRGAVLATRGNLNNDIGLPLTLLQLRPEHRCAVLEMGANHAGEIAWLAGLARPDVALVNNAGAAHLEGFGGLEGVARAKGEIYAALPRGGTAVINADDDYAGYWRTVAGARRVLSFGLVKPADVSARVEEQEAGARLQLITPQGRVQAHLAVPGRHNVMNALAATACALAAGVGLKDISAGLAAFTPAPGRLASLPGPAGSRVVDDSYNANPSSLAAALAAVAAQPGEHWLVLGDMFELGADAARLHADCGAQARAAGFSRLLTLGEHSAEATRAFGAGARHFAADEAALAAAVLEGIGPQVTVLVKGSRGMKMERIVRRLAGEVSAREKQEAA